MRTSCLAAVKRSVLLLLVTVLSVTLLKAQITVTSPVPSSFTYYSASAEGAIVFGVKNTNTAPITITEVGNHIDANFAGTFTLWYHPTAVTGAPTAITAANGWVSVATSTVSSSATAGIRPIFTGLNITLAPNAIYRFAISGPARSPLYGGANTTPNIYKGSGLEIYVQNNPNSPGYGGAFPGPPTSTPRSFIGSVTFVPAAPCTTPPVAGSAVASASKVCAGNSFSLELESATIGTGQTYQWQRSDDNSTWTNIGASSSSPTYTTTQSTTSYYRAAVTCGGSTSYSASVKVEHSTPVSGTYTINSAFATAGTNFQSFKEAIEALTFCGVNGPVVFNVDAGSGPFNEQVTIPAINGASATNTITFNGNGATIQATPVSATRHIIRLDGADYITFNNFKLVANAGSTYGWGVHLSNGADHNTISNCEINISAVTSTTQSNSGGIVVSNSTTSVTAEGSANYNSIRNNTIIGGYQGVIINGASGSLNAVNNSIRNNTIKDFYSTGIELVDNDGAVVAYNDINRAGRTAVTTFTGVELGESSKNCSVNGNRIHDTHTSASSQSGTAYGIYLVDCDATIGAENKVTNNLIYKFNSGSGTIYALYNNDADGAHYFHNTVVLDNASSTSGTTRGFYQTTEASNIQFKNNIIYITRGGTGAKNCLYFGSTTSSIVSNNNILYINAAAGTNGIGYYSSNFASIADWKTANNGAYDQQSISIDPLFTNASANDFKPTEGFLDNKGEPVGVASDILQAARSATTPDAGAFEFTIPACTGAPTPGTTIASITNICVPATPIMLSVTGASQASGITYQWQRSSDNLTWTDITGATEPGYVAPGAFGTTYFRRQMTCSGTNSHSAAVMVTLSPALVYATLPYTESFENSWRNLCATNDIPNDFWRNNPATGNNSWRKNDEGATAWTGTSGAYTPAASNGSFSARFHSYSASKGTKGQFDLHINANTSTPEKKLTFDYINTSGNDSLVVYVSTDGGASFTRLDSVLTSMVWKTKTITFSSTSATTVVRFEGVSDNGSTDIGLDNIKIADLLDCTGTPASGTVASTTITLCNPATPVILNVTGIAAADGFTYQWQSSTDNVTWTDISGETGIEYTVSGISSNTYFRRQINCTFSGSSNYSPAVLIAVNPPAYTTLPFTESFETGWVDICDTKDVPNNFWRNTPATGNNSWRKNDEGATAWTGTSGAYTPAASDGSFSARFHSYNASKGTKGQFDLYVNANTGVSKKQLTFDYINTSGNDSLIVYVSTDGGASFARLDSVKTSTVWKTKTIFFSSTSATTVVRFEGVSDFGTTDIGLDNIRVVDFPDCSATPAGGTAASNRTDVCNATTPFSLSVSGASNNVDGLTYQWQSSTDNVTWTNIAGATGASFDTAGIAASTYFRRQTICAAAGLTGNSTEVLVRFATPDYTTLPFTESFETGWVDLCDTKDVPNNFWRNTPATGNNSWRKNDEGATAWTGTSGAYTPAASNGSFSARFHSYNASKGTKGQFDLHINANTGVSAKRLTFDYINTSGSDSLVVYVSTNGGANFTRLDSVLTSTVWKTKTITFTSTSATTVVRFEGVSDFGTTDIGLDNINLIDFPDCSGTLVGGTAASNRTEVCNATTPFTLSVNGATDANKLTYQWQSSTDNVTWTNIAGATGASFDTAGIAASTYFRRQITCSGTSEYSAAVLVRFATPDYTTLPFTESFETGWVDICDTKDVPNNFWRNTPATGNNSWRKDDEGVSAAWSSPTLGMYTPAASDGTASARFHARNASKGSKGRFDLHINANTASEFKQLTFDYINTSGSDSLVIYVSTDGGATFARLDSVNTSTVWKTQTVLFTSTSATTVVRFEGVADFGSTDIGLDNISIVEFPDCSGTPVGGTAASSAANVCQETFTLSAKGATSGAGISYQWQSSTDNVSWADISGATELSYTTTQVGSHYYRLSVKCSFSGATGYSNTVQVISPSLVSGTYTIDNSQATGGTNFNTFNEAYEFLRCGINGPVVFDVKTGNGPYNEQLIMTAVPGASATNTITFRGNGVTAIEFGTTASNERAIIKLRGARHFIFDNLVINANTGTYGYGVQLISNSDSNTVKNCIINSSLTATNTNFAGIVINGSESGSVSTGTVLCDYNTFSNNTIVGGYYGVTLYATFNGGANGYNQFINNDIKDFYQYGMYVGGSYNTLIEGNRFSRPTRTSVGDFYGIHFTTEKNTTSIISKNKISNPFGGAPTSTNAFYGINFNNADGSIAAENNVINNIIYNINGEGAVYGIANTSSDYAYYFHNTISLDNTASTSSQTTRGFYQTAAITGLYFYNNIISITRGGSGNKHGIYLNTNLVNDVDFNNYYINSTGGSNYLGYYTANRANLNDWRTATAFDANSQSANPSFVDAVNGNLVPGNSGVDNKGVYLGIDTDIVDAVRSNVTPDMGAFEFTPPPCALPPVAGTTDISATVVCQNSPVRLNLNIGTFGSGQTFQWESATIATGPFTAVGAPMLTPDTIITASATLYYRAAITCSGFTVYSDTVLLTVNPALPTGTYTINKNAVTNYVPGVAGGNFTSFADVKAAMSCGITGGPVVFDVVAGSGTYNEQFKLDSIPGVSAVNTITFRGNGNTIAFASTTTAERAVIKLNGADHIIFDSLTIEATGGTYGYGVQLINNADSNTFRKCTILANNTSNLADFAGVVINATDEGSTTAGATLCDANLFDSNTISGGYYGVTLVGSTGAPVYYNQFINNKIEEFYNYGIYLIGTSNTLIEGNTFTRPTRTTSATSVYGIYVTASPSNRLQVSKNRFSQFFGGAPTSTAAFYGVYHNAVDAASGNENKIVNNLFYNLDGEGAINALHNNGSNNVHYYHNTIAIDNTASTTTAATAALYVATTTVSGVEFQNNMVTISRGGTGTKHALYLGVANGVTSNYNNLYVKASANSFIGYNGSSRVALTDWQTASGKDANSLSLDPIYTDPAAGDFTSNFLPLDNKGTALSIATDIVNNTRSTTTPDMGAFEFTPAACANPPVAGAAVVTPNTGICLETPIELTLTGHSPIGTLTFQWQTSADGTNWTNISDLQYTPDFKTITTTSTYFRAAVTCSGTTTYSTPTQVNLNSILPAGSYTINNTAPATYVPGVAGGNFASFQSAVDAMACGIAGAVVFDVAPGTYTEQIRIPYVPGSSSSNTVRFQGPNSASGTARLTFGASSAANYTLQLDSTRYITFTGLTIEATDASYGRAVVLTRSASNDSILNSTIIAPVTTVATENVAGIYADAFKGGNISIKGNTITNGTSGIHFTGTSSTALAAKGHVIDGNTVSGAYSHGINVQYTKGIHITNNTVNVNAATATNTAGIYTNYADSAFQLKGNVVTINNNSGSVYGIYVFNSHSSNSDSGIVAANKVLADNNNTGSVYGLAIASSNAVNVVNNTIGINSAGALAYGLYSFNNGDKINFYNNTSNIAATSATAYAGYFSNSAASNIRVYNNVFSNNGGGRALYANNPSYFTADYNMLYTTGANLVQVATGSINHFATIKEWKNTWNWDQSSISYAPAFVSNTDLRPDLNNPDVWAMHGRGLQIKGNTFDFNNNYRPDSLTAGVPDLGAYEFYPIALPTVLTATPAAPVANSMQTFTYGSDTVMKITWGGSVPPSVEVRRFSGVVPSGLAPGADSMFFYTKVDIPGGANYNYAAKLYYIDSWQGSIPQQYMIGMGRTTPSNAWVVGQNSKLDLAKKEISQEGITYLDRFTGLVNVFSQPAMDDSSSNRGKDFWVGYQRTNGFTTSGGAQDMVIYMGAGAQEANVTITIEGTNGTPWVRNYTVPANSALQSDLIPKNGADDARLVTDGQHDKKGIHITSDVPIVAYAHIYEGTNSGATMLMPTTVWGYEYYTLSSRQNYTSSSYSAFHIVAQHDSTWVEINPSKPTLGGWAPNGGPVSGKYLVKLNKGDVYQVLGANLSGSEGYDLTGSYIKAIGNAQGQCYPIAVFAGSTRTGIGCGSSAGGSGDLIIQQVLPYQAWGNKYVTAPTSTDAGPNASSNMTNIYRIMVKDPTTEVRRNGQVLTGYNAAGRYYQYESGSADYIESNKPVLVAQFMSSSSSCTNTSGNGDPEMFYLSPLQQAIKSTQFYRNDRDDIEENFITLVIPTEGLTSLRIDGVHYSAYPATERYVYAHPNLSGYSVVTKKWAAGNGSSNVSSEHPFTGIVYGLGSVESYGYNIGTLVKNLNNQSTISTVYNTGATPTEYTCEGAPFKIRALLPVIPTSLQWRFSEVRKLSVRVDSIQQNPVPADTVTIDGMDYYAFDIDQSFTMDSAGIFNIPIRFWSPEIESCDKSKDGLVRVQVLPAPKTDFQVSFMNGGVAGCEGETATLTGDIITANGIALNQWNWTFSNGNTATGQIQTISYPTAGTYPVKLSGITADGCVSDTTKQIVFNAKPVVTLVKDTVEVCPGGDVTFTVANPVAGVTYNWYDAATGGTLVGTGVSFTATTVALPARYYVEGVAATCVSVEREQATAVSLQALPKPVVNVTASTATSVTFGWTAVTGAVSYEVSLDNGATFSTPSSGTTGLTHTVTGLGTLQSTTVIVRANGATACELSLSAPVKGCTNSSAQVTPALVEVCPGTDATFNVQSPEAGITYSWYATPTGGTALASGTSFTVTNVTGTVKYYVEQSSASGCISTTRTEVTATVFAELTKAVVKVDSTSKNMIRFKWDPVPGAASYEVSIDNGATYTTPSSGATGLTHTVSDLLPATEITLMVRALGTPSCKTSVSSPVKGMTDVDEIFVPNTFTPNGDGRNDVLLVYGRGIDQMKFIVFNQWGQKLFESANPSMGWDGTQKGKQQPSGVYIYVVHIVMKDGSIVERKGSVNLVR